MKMLRGDESRRVEEWGDERMKGKERVNKVLGPWSRWWLGESNRIF